jgi:hypothetical protein
MEQIKYSSEDDTNSGLWYGAITTSDGKAYLTVKIKAHGAMMGHAMSPTEGMWWSFRVFFRSFKLMFA